jgi:hypothetical protein
VQVIHEWVHVGATHLVVGARDPGARASHTGLGASLCKSSRTGFKWVQVIQDWVQVGASHPGMGASGCSSTRISCKSSMTWCKSSRTRCKFVVWRFEFWPFKLGF